MKLRIIVVSSVLTLIALVSLGFTQQDFYKAGVELFRSHGIEEGREHFKRHLYETGDPGALFGTAWADWLEGNFQEAEGTCMFLLAESQDQKIRGRTLYLLGHIQSNTGRHEEAFESFSLAYRLFGNMGNDKNLFLTSLGLGYVSILERDFENADNFLQKAIYHNQKAQQPLGYYWVLQQKIAYINRDFEKALEYSQNALQVYQEIQDKQGIVSSLGFVGFFQMLLGRMDIGLATTKEAIALSKEIGSHEEQVYNQTALIFYNRCQNRPFQDLLKEGLDWVQKNDDFVLKDFLDFVTQWECPKEVETQVLGGPSHLPPSQHNTGTSKPPPPDKNGGKSSAPGS